MTKEQIKACAEECVDAITAAITTDEEEAAIAAALTRHVAAAQTHTCSDQCERVECVQARRIRELEDALQNLVDVQNGCPLHKYEKDWNAAMDDAHKLLMEAKQ